MKQKLLLSILLIFCCFYQTHAQVSTGFETPCANQAYPFFTGCFPGWISTSGSPSIKNTNASYNIYPYEGNNYAELKTNLTFRCNQQFPNVPGLALSDGIAVNHNFQQGKTYRLTYAFRKLNPAQFNSFPFIQLFLTNGLINKTGNKQDCLDMGNFPSFTPSSSTEKQLIKEYDINYLRSDNWILETVDFIPTSNFSQLWIQSDAISFYNPYNTSLNFDMTYIFHFDAINITPQCSDALNFEPNDNTWATTPINSNSNISAGISSSTDIDYYTFSTTTTGALNINLSNLPADYDIELRRVDGGQFIGNGILGGTNSENINIPDLPPGNYLLKIWGHNGANSIFTCYNLNLTFIQIINTSCQSYYDMATNNNTPFSSLSIPHNTDIKGLIETQADVDYYSYTTQGGYVNITLTNLPHDYDIRLRNSNNEAIYISQEGGNTNESINTYLNAGLYYIEVYGWNGANNSSSCYTLRANENYNRSLVSSSTLITQANKPEIKVDKLKTNESKLELKVYPNPAHDLLQINIPTTGGMLQITDAKGLLVMTQQVNKKQELINISNLQPGMYLLRIQNGKSFYTAKFIKQ